MTTTKEKADELREMLGDIEVDVLTSYTLADAIREGSMVSEKAHGWGSGAKQCAMHAAVTAAIARGYMGQ
jgi:hypothetical protein